MTKKLFSILFIISSFYSIASGHAHIFIDYKIHACINENGLEGFFVNWTFDRMFTSFIQKEFDKDKDGVLNPQEQQSIFTNAFQKLKADNYFAVIKINGEEQPIPEPNKFSARFIKDKEVVAYSFFIPLANPATTQEKEVQIYFFDPVIYIAFTIMPADITLKNNSAKINAKLLMQQVKHTNRPTLYFKEG